MQPTTASPSRCIADHATARMLARVSASSLSVQDQCRFALYGVGPCAESEPLTIQEVFSRRARVLPDSIAANHLGATLTYRRLDEASDMLARELRKKGVERGSRVCLLVQRSLDMLVGIFGILKSGASYIPLDGGVVTNQTLSYVLKDSGAALVVCTSAFKHRAPEELKVLCLEDFASPSGNGALRDPIEEQSSSRNEAYVIYTSGTLLSSVCISLAEPHYRHDWHAQGCERVSQKRYELYVTTRSTQCLLITRVAVLCHEPGNLGIRPGTKVSQLLSVAFDMCVWEVLGCLLNGGTLVLRGSSKLEWERTLRSVHVVIVTPAILQCYRAADYPAIRVVATAGEPCPQALADEWSVGKAFYNCCGPTEVRAAMLYGEILLMFAGRRPRS